jgi:hypothetical protein
MRTRALWALALAALVATPAFAVPCDNEKSADRAMEQARRTAEQAQRAAEQVARQAQHEAEMAAARARWAAEHAPEQAQREADRAQWLAEQAAQLAQRAAERAARAAERATERAAIGAPGVIVTNDALMFIDGPEVRRDDVVWADDIRSRRIRRPTSTDTVLRVGPGMTLALTNLSGDIVVQGWNRNDVHIQADHDRSDRLVTDVKDGQLRLSVRSREGQPADVDWNLTVPVWLPLEISGIESAITVTGLRASVRAQSMRGDVRVSACQGPMELNSVEGEVHVEDVNGNVTAGSVNNAVRLVRVLGPIAAQSVNGDIQMDDVSSADVSASTLNGKVYYASKFQPHGRYALSSHNGKLYVGVDGAQTVDFTVSSFNGQVESEIPLPPTPPTPPAPPATPAAPAAMVWHKWNFTWPAEVASASTTPAPAPNAERRATKFVYVRPEPGRRSPQVELESFGGSIQLVKLREIERTMQIRRAVMDSIRVVRELNRLRQLNVRETPEASPDSSTPERH